MADKLKKFLVLGSVSSYIPSQERTLQIVEIKLPGLEEMLSKGEEKQIPDILTEAAANIKSGLTDPVMLSYATALCVKCSEDKIRSMVYKAIPSIFLTTDALFQFLETLRSLTLQFSELKEKKKVGMWGQGMRKAIKQWYTLQISNGDKHLALMLATNKASHGWSHKDVLKLIHFKAPTPSANAIINYFAFSNKKSFEELSPDVAEIAKNAKNLKDFKPDSDISALLSNLKIMPTAVPAKLFKDQKAWAEYIHKLPLREVLKRLEFLSTCKDFNEKEIIKRLEKADPEDVDAAEVFIELSKYECCHYVQRKNRAIKRFNGQAKDKKAGKEKYEVKEKPLTEVNPKIVENINGLLLKCLDKIPNENLTWTFILHRQVKHKESISYKYLDSVKCLTFTMQYLKRTGQVFVSGNKCIKPCPADSEVSDFIKKYRRVIDKRSSAIDKIQAHESTDVVVYAAYALSYRRKLHALTVYEELKKKLNKPDLKLVILLFLKPKSTSNDESDFIIYGFDERVPRLMINYAKGVF